MRVLLVVALDLLDAVAVHHGGRRARHFEHALVDLRLDGLLGVVHEHDAEQEVGNQQEQGEHDDGLPVRPRRQGEGWG